jgi:hypothetical protein
MVAQKKLSTANYFIREGILQDLASPSSCGIDMPADRAPSHAFAERGHLGG